MNLAAGLLTVAACRHYAWQHFPIEAQGMASKGLGAVAVLVLLAVVWHGNKSRPLALVLCWWAWEETQVLLCSFAYMHTPWAVEPGQGICSAAVGFDIGAAGILAVAVIAHNLSSLTGGVRQK